MGKKKTQAAAVLFGITPADIIDVGHHDGHLTVTTTDGVVYVHDGEQVCVLSRPPTRRERQAGVTDPPLDGLALPSYRAKYGDPQPEELKEEDTSGDAKPDGSEGDNPDQPTGPPLTAEPDWDTASVDHVVAWVTGDSEADTTGIPARAQRALEVEAQRDKPRSTLISRVEKASAAADQKE